MTSRIEIATGCSCATVSAARSVRPRSVLFLSGLISRFQAPAAKRVLAAVLLIWAATVALAGTTFAETVWTHWSGSWEVALDRQADGATCLWSTYDAPPPNHVRRLTFANNRRGEVVVIVSDRREPLHRLISGSGTGVLLMLGGRMYTIEVGAGMPLPGLPGGMLIGRLTGERTNRFARLFGEHDGEEARLHLPGGWSWRLSLRGAAGAAEDVTSCLTEAMPGHSGGP